MTPEEHLLKKGGGPLRGQFNVTVPVMLLTTGVYMIRGDVTNVRAGDSISVGCMVHLNDDGEYMCGEEISVEKIDE